MHLIIGEKIKPFSLVGIIVFTFLSSLRVLKFHFSWKAKELLIVSHNDYGPFGLEPLVSDVIQPCHIQRL